MFWLPKNILNFRDLNYLVVCDMKDLSQSIAYLDTSGSVVS